MKDLSDGVVEHLRTVTAFPELKTDRYEILSEIGSGGMGTVYLALDRYLQRNVALKVLDTLDPGSQLRERMIREARILAKLEHPGIVPVHDVSTLPDGRVFYAMKLVKGTSLNEHLGSGRSPGLRERLRIFEKICQSVAFAHAHGVIHRDLKPSNVMVGAFGEVLVMDWGVAKVVREESSPSSRPPPIEPDPALDSPETDACEAETLARPQRSTGSEHTEPGIVLGTPGYMPPEQAEGRLDEVGPRADVYALGVVLKELLQDTREAKPKRLAAIMAKASHLDRDQRYDSVKDLVADVGRFLDGEPVSAYRENALDRLERFVLRYRAPILLLLAYLVVRSLVLILAGT
jgi:serine/threonine-protein kinase